MSGPTNILWYSSVAVQFLFCLHLLWSRLARKHPIFTLYLACSVLRSLGAMRFRPYPDGALPISYTYFWLWTEPVLLLLQIAVALEVHAKLWQDHQNIVKAARPLMLIALFAALALAALPLRAELQRFGAIRLQTAMHFEFLIKRYLSTVLAAFLTLSALAFVWKVRKNVASTLFRHEGMLAIYFAIYAVAYLTVNMGWVRPVLMNNYMLSALTVCLVVWLSIFPPRREITVQA
ncbi:MAG TPA: hypothetical protein VKX49_25865 [Bryobacteraceae bacterium]|nr:hypothetical protein [Bryobacteraceae bacterium]